MKFKEEYLVLRSDFSSALSGVTGMFFYDYETAKVAAKNFSGHAVPINTGLAMIQIKKEMEISCYNF